MPRAKKTTDKRQEVEVLVPFNGMYRGDRAVVAIDQTVAGWINVGLVRLTEAVSGTDQAGSGEPLTHDQGSVAQRTGDSGASGDGAGQGFGSGGYGAFEG